jgi:hypothetical protein
MPCVCEQCIQHARTLGLANSPDSKSAIRKAYRAAAKLWHPDHFENYPAQRQVAEERFKQIQVAYRELLEHNENPRQFPIEDPFNQTPKPEAHTPAISFGGTPFCFVAPDFSLPAERIIERHVPDPADALAIVDLSGAGSHTGTFSQFILFTRHGILVRDLRQVVSLLWYAHLGAINLIDQRRNGRLPMQQRIAEKISGIQQKYALEIRRRDGTIFCSIAGQVDDSVKRVMYSFLLQMIPKPRP